MLTSDAQYPTTIATFDTMDEAKSELNKHKSTINKMSGAAGTVYQVEEFYIIEATYDEDGEFEEGGDMFLLPFTPDELARVEQ